MCSKTITFVDGRDEAATHVVVDGEREEVHTGARARLDGKRVRTMIMINVLSIECLNNKNIAFTGSLLRIEHFFEGRLQRTARSPFGYYIFEKKWC